jgi:hypothetical protein
MDRQRLCAHTRAVVANGTRELKQSGRVLFRLDALLDVFDHVLADHGLAMHDAHMLDSALDDFGFIIICRAPFTTWNKGSALEFLHFVSLHVGVAPAWKK